MQQVLMLVGGATVETLVMTFFSTLFALVLGFPLGVLLNVTGALGITPKPLLNQAVSRVIDVLRSFPFFILMIVLLPFTRFILGSAIGTTAIIIPLSIAAMPFVARLTENALSEVDAGLVQAARAMGSTNWQIVWKVLVPESLPSIVSGITLTIITLISYSAMAGVLGGGGLGDLALRYGFHRFNTPVLVVAVAVIIVIVVLIQYAGTKLANAIQSRR